MNEERTTLRLITLNAWCGRKIGPLCDFLAEQAERTDIFCFQEVFDAPQHVLDQRHKGEGLRGDQFARMSRVLRDFHGMFAYHDSDPTRMSLAMFVGHGLCVRRSGDLVVFRPAVPKEDGGAVRSSRKLQFATIAHNDRDVTIANYHGLWDGGHKRDTPERLRQSIDVRGIVDTLPGRHILCGDLNLDPDTESVRILAEGNVDLVARSGVPCTRTPLYRHFGDPDYSNFADYVFTSPGIDIRHFEVMPDEVSDHSPLLLAFA